MTSVFRLGLGMCVCVCVLGLYREPFMVYSARKHINVLDWILSFNTTDASLKGRLFWDRVWPRYRPLPPTPPVSLNHAFMDIKNRTNLNRVTEQMQKQTV